MANQFLDATVYAKTMLVMAKNYLVMGKLVDGQYRDQVNDDNNLTVNIKRPPRFAPNDASANSAALAAQDILAGAVQVAVNQYAKVHVSVGDIEYIAHYTDLMKNAAMKAAASTLAHQIDKFLATKLLGFSSNVAGAATGSANATDISKGIASSIQASAAYTRLQDLGVPSDSLSAICTPLDGELIRGSLLGTNIQGVNKDALSKAKIPLVSEVDWYQTQQVPALTVGTRVATGTTLINNGTLSVNYRDVKGAGLYYQDITVDGQTGSKTIKAGEGLTIAGVYAYDWRNQVALPDLMQFTVVSDVTLSAGGGTGGTIRITPPIIVPGTSDGVDTNANTAFATCSAAAVNDVAVTHNGVASTTYRIRAAWAKPAIAMVSAKLRMPDTGVASFAQDPETGIAIRYWRGSDITTGAHIQRWDCVYGAAVTDPLMGTRVNGT